MRDALLVLFGIAGIAAGTWLATAPREAPALPPAETTAPPPVPPEEEVPADLPGLPPTDPEDVPEAHRFPWGDPPPPPGPPGSILLRLVDADSGCPVATNAVLWRLGIPEDEHWSEGDEKVRAIRVEENGTVVEGLDPGRYRLCCEDQRKGAEDPPEFRVASGENRFEGRVLVPRTMALHLRVFDEEGGPLERSVREFTIGSIYSTHRDRPPWARARRARLPDGSFEEESISIGGGVG